MQDTMVLSLYALNNQNFVKYSQLPEQERAQKAEHLEKINVHTVLLRKEIEKRMREGRK